MGQPAAIVLRIGEEEVEIDLPDFHTPLDTVHAQKMVDPFLHAIQEVVEDPDIMEAAVWDLLDRFEPQVEEEPLRVIQRLDIERKTGWQVLHLPVESSVINFVDDGRKLTLWFTYDANEEGVVNHHFYVVSTGVPYPPLTHVASHNEWHLFQD